MMLEYDVSTNHQGGRSDIPPHNESDRQIGRDGAGHQHEALTEGGFDEDAPVDYWEEVTTDDGYIQYYNHITGEYFTSLPAAEDSGATTNGTPMPSPREPFVEEVLSTRGEATRTSKEMMLWNGVEGGVFVPCSGGESGAMGACPIAVGNVGELPEPVAGCEENEHGSISQIQGKADASLADDDSTTARDDIRRAILILYPGRFMQAVLKAAKNGAIGQLKNIVMAEAKRRRRSLLAIRADFRQNKVSTPGQVRPRSPRVKFSGERERDGAKDGEDEPCLLMDGQTEESADSWRSSSSVTREREVISGDKLAEACTVLNVLFSKTSEEARLTLRTIDLSCQGIGPQGAQDLAPALSSCVIVALYLGNNHIGYRGVVSLAEGLKRARGLQKLHLNDNGITDDSCHRLMDALSPLKVLFTLDLSHNPFGVKGCRSIANFLCQPGCPLRSLSIAGCLDIHPAAWKTIGASGAGGKPWDLPRPGDDGAVALAAALLSPYGCPLRNLRLVNVGMRTIGIKAIAAALCANVTLETIDLSGNDFVSNRADENAWESAAELLSFGLKVNTRVHAVTLRACGLAREQVFAVLGNVSSKCFRGRAHGDHWIARGLPEDAHDAGGLYPTSHEKETPLPWWEEKKIGFRAALLRDWLLDAARLQGICYPRPPSLDPADELFLFKRRSRGQGNMVDIFAEEVWKPRRVAGSGCVPTKTRRSSSTSTLPPSELSASEEASLVGPILWSGLTALQRLIDLHETVELRSSFRGDSSSRRREARVSFADEGGTPRAASLWYYKLLVQLNSHDATAEEELDSYEHTKRELSSASGRWGVVDDLLYSPLQENDGLTAGGEASRTIRVGEENGQVGEEREYPDLDPIFPTRTFDDQECPPDTNRVEKSCCRGVRTSKTGNSLQTPKHDEGSVSLTASLLSFPDEPEIKSSARKALPHDGDASRAEEFDEAICPYGGESYRQPAAEGGDSHITVDKMDDLTSASDDPNRLSAGQSQIFTLHSDGDSHENSAPSRDRCSNRERTGRTKMVDAPARSGEVFAGEDVQTREARHELSMETTGGCGGEQGVNVAALERGVEEGRKLEAIVEDRLRELEESKITFLSARRKLRESRRTFLQNVSTGDSVLKAQLVRAQSNHDLTMMEDRVRRLGPNLDSAKAMARASEAELMATRNRLLGTQSESKNVPLKGYFVGIQELECLWRERIANADELEGELQEARRTIAERESGSRVLQARSDEHGSTFREKLEEISTSLTHLSVEKSALWSFSKVLSNAITTLDAMARSARDEKALRALVPAGSGRRDLDLQVAEAIRETSKVTAEIEAARKRRDQAMSELESARLALFVARCGDTTSGQEYASEPRASTCPARIAPSDASPLEDITKGDVLRARKIDQETAPLEDISGGEMAREAGICGEQGGVLDVGDGGREREERGDNATVHGPMNRRAIKGPDGDRVIARELSSVALVSAIDIVSHPGPDDGAAGSGVAIAPPTAEDIRKLKEAFFCAERDHRNALARNEAPHVKRALSLMRDHAVILHLANNEDSRDTLEGGAIQMKGGRRRRPRGETPLIGIGLNSRVELGARVSTHQGGVEEDGEGNPVLPQVDERGLTVGQRLRRLRDVREKAQREKRRAHAEYSRKLKGNLRARKRFVLAERQAGRIARMMDSKKLAEKLRERGWHNADSPELEELRRVFVENVRSEIRVRLRPSSRRDGPGVERNPDGYSPRLEASVRSRPGGSWPCLGDLLRKHRNSSPFLDGAMRSFDMPSLRNYCRFGFNWRAMEQNMMSKI